MNRAFAAILTAPIVFIAFTLIALGTMLHTEDVKMDEYIMSFAIDYSTDAAVAEMLETPHLGQDYGDEGKVNSDPGVALTSFVNFMCMNYNLPLTENAKMQVEDSYIPIFCVATYDGYYIYEQRMGEDGGVYMQSSLKMPYTYNVGDKYYALNLGLDNALRFYNGHLTKVLLKDEGISADDVYSQVNTKVSDDLMYDFQKTTGRGHEFLYLPNKLSTMTKVNPIKGPSVLAFIDKWDVGTTHKLTSFSIGGARIEKARMVAGYTGENKDGTKIKLYCYADLLPKGAPIEEMFTTVEGAAKAGYYWDPVYM